MARIILELPAVFSFTTDIPVTINYINYGAHVGNDSMLSILHEARIRLLKSHGFSELNIDGLGLIITDVAVVYKAEAYQGDNLEVRIAVQDPNKYGCDFFYQVIHKDSGKEIARAKTGCVFFDYNAKKVSEAPKSFKDLFFN